MSSQCQYASTLTLASIDLCTEYLNWYFPTSTRVLFNDSRRSSRNCTAIRPLKARQVQHYTFLMKPGVLTVIIPRAPNPNLQTPNQQTIIPPNSQQARSWQKSTMLQLSATSPIKPKRKHVTAAYCNCCIMSLLSY